MDWRFKPDLPDPWSATGTGAIGAAVALASTSPARLRTTLNWTLNIELGGVLGLFDSDAEALVRALIAQLFDPQTIGGTRVDDRSFFIDRILPTMSLGGARLNYASVQADPSGMTVGGSVQTVYAPRETLGLNRTPFGRPAWFGTCRSLAMVGGGAPPKTLKITDVTNLAGVAFDSYGAYCGETLIDPSGIAGPFLNQPPLGPGGTVASVGFSIPALIARGIVQDVKMILRTARGVRMINFGHPVVEVNAEGNVDFLTIFIDNCLYLTSEQVHMIKWAQGKEKGSVDEFKPPPKEDTNWMRLIESGRGFEVQLVSLSGLEPGELLRFRSSHHAIDVTADATGQALVPVFFSLAEDIPSTRLERVNRQSLGGKFRVKGASFVRRASLPSGGENQLDAGLRGAVRLTRIFQDRITRTEFGVGGVPIGVELSTQARPHVPGTDAVALNPHPLPPVEDLFASAVRHIHSILDVVPVPGFERDPIAVARMTDGSAVLLHADASGRTRIAGSFSGPIGAISTAGDWGMSSAGGRTVMFQVTRT